MTHPISFVYLSLFILDRIKPIALKICFVFQYFLSWVMCVKITGIFFWAYIIYVELGLHKSDVKCSPFPPHYYPPVIPSVQNVLKANGVWRETETYFSLYLLYSLNFQVIPLRSYHLKNALGTFLSWNPCRVLQSCTQVSSWTQCNGKSLCFPGSRSTQISCWWVRSLSHGSVW